MPMDPALAPATGLAKKNGGRFPNESDAYRQKDGPGATLLMQRTKWQRKLTLHFDQKKQAGHHCLANEIYLELPR